MAWGCILPLLLALALLCPGAREEMGTGSEGPQGGVAMPGAGCWVRAGAEELLPALSPVTAGAEASSALCDGEVKL